MGPKSRWGYLRPDQFLDHLTVIKRAPIVSIIGINQIHYHILQSEQKLFNNIASNFLSSSSHRFGDILTKRTKTRMVNIYFSSISMKHEHIFNFLNFFFSSQESWAKKNGTECWTPQGCRQAGLDKDIQQSIIHLQHIAVLHFLVIWVWKSMQYFFLVRKPCGPVVVCSSKFANCIFTWGQPQC